MSHRSLMCKTESKFNRLPSLGSMRSHCVQAFMEGVSDGNDNPATTKPPPPAKRKVNICVDVDDLDFENPLANKDENDQPDLQRLEQENSRLRHIVEGHYLPSNLQPAGMLDRRMAYVSDAVEQANLSSILFISRPMAAALTKRPFQIALLILSLFFFLECSYEIFLLGTSEWGFRSSTVRFQATQLRNGQRESISSPHVKSFGLLHNSFAITSVFDARFETQNNSIVAHFPDFVHATGFFIVTSDDRPEFDATRFHLEASDDGGQTWRRVAASSWRFGFGGKTEFIDADAQIPLARGDAVFFSLAPNWQSYVNGPLRSFLNTLFFAVTGMLAYVGSPWAARSAFIAGFLCTFVLSVIVALGHVWRGQYTISCVFWTEALGNLFIPISVVWVPQKLVLALFFLGVHYLVVMSVVILVVAGLPFSDMISSLIAGSAMASTALLVMYAREFFLSRSKTTMLPDKQAYDQKWAALLEHKSNRHALGMLAALTLSLQASHAPVACQYNRQPAQSATPALRKRRSAPALWNAQTGAGLPGTRDLTNPVCSLDQLYSQAVAVDVILRNKVQSWAERGLFPMQPQHWHSPNIAPHSPSGSASGSPRATPTFVKWAEARGSKELRAKVKWGAIKSPERAIEKAVRTYHSDVSYLVDIVRQSIVFASVQDLMSALEDISADEEVRIVRVKNRMDPSYDSWSSAGYRDVSINLRISTAETRRLGVENHVMEIQLVLHEFASLRHDAGHARYVTWRNERGC